jgi:hypothetical protein
VLDDLIQSRPVGWGRSFHAIQVMQLAHQSGQTSALAAGVDSSHGRVIVTLDADGQNDPRDIPRLVQLIREGADVACGWRKRRQDPWLSRTFPSHLANGLISFLSGVPLHDHGCGIKAYRREILTGLPLFGEMHRLLPAWCAWRGARVSELEVVHHPRRAGRSKYGIGRTFHVVLDILLAKFFGSYITRPLHFVGGIAAWMCLAGGASAVVAFIDKFGPNRFPPLRTPLLLLAVGLGLAATQLVVLGLLGEILIRLYHAIGQEKTYRILGMKQWNLLSASGTPQCGRTPRPD